MTASFAKTERRGPVLIVTIDRPERRNALHSAAHFELSKIFDDFETDSGLRVAILTGTGDRAFCAGNDLKVQAEGGSLERPPSGFAGLTKRSDRTKPIVAAVNGVALGGGFETVLACDLAVATTGSRFALPEVGVGLVPLAAMHLLPRQLPGKRALAVLLAGSVITGEEALSYGLVNELVAPGEALAAALRWAERLLAGSPIAIATCLDIVEHSLRTPDVRVALAAEYASLDRLRASEDFREGPLAFAQKRRPRWST